MTPVFWKYTWKNLKENRVRTLVTIIGIVLSVALVTAVTVSISSLFNYAEEVAILNTGDWHLELFAADDETIDALSDDGRVSKYGVLRTVGYARIGSQNAYKPYLFVGAMSDGFSDIMTLTVTEGRMPENDAELLIPNHLKNDGGVELTLGESLTLSLGSRKLGGITCDQHTGFIGGESIEVQESLIEDGRTVTYTVVGFYERPSFEDRSAPGYTALTVDTADAGGSCEVWILLKNINDTSSFLEEKEAAGLAGQTNRQRLRYSGASDSDLAVLLYALASILMVMIVIGSVALIGNAFSISVTERIRQFGLLKSLGATKRQLMGSVLCEGLMLCAAAIPLGILAGIAGIAITIWGCQDLFMTFLSDFSETCELLEFQVYADSRALLLAVVLSLFTVLLSAWLPARKALRLTPIEAIRQNGESRIRPRRIRTGFLTRKLFGLEGTLASKNFKRSRKRYRSTIFSLFFSIVLFICANSFCYYLNRSVEDSTGNDNYDLVYHMPGFGKETALTAFHELKSLTGVEDSALLFSQTMALYVDPEYISKEYASYIGADGHCTCRVVFVEDESYRAYLEESGLDAALYLDPDHPAALLYDRTRLVEPDQVHIFQIFDRRIDSVQLLMAQRDISIGRILDAPPWFAPTGSTQLFLPASAIDSWGLELSETSDISAYFLAQDHHAVYEEMRSLSETFGGYVSDYAQTMSVTRALLTLIQIFTIGFLTLISLIAAANVFNTVSTNVLLRRREFSILRSVGMTEKGLYKTLCYECLIYGMKSLLYALPVSVALTWLIYMRIKRTGMPGEFYIPWQTLLIAVGSVFIIVFITMLYAARRLQATDLAEALRNENA